MTFRISALGLIALACSSSLTHGAGPDAAVAVDGIRLGEQLSGPAISTGDLKGHVVLVEFWGIH